jgi:hypothetical protein
MLAGKEKQMSMDRMMGDEIYIESPDGKTIGPVKASVQRNKVYVNDETLVIEEGGKILRPLPSGKSESHSILQVDFFKGPRRALSHYEITTRKDASLVPTPSSTTVNIANSQGIQVGNHNVQNIVGSLEQLIQAIDSSDATPEHKAEAKGKLKAFLQHPATAAVLGAIAAKLIAML